MLITSSPYSPPPAKSMQEEETHLTVYINYRMRPLSSILFNGGEGKGEEVNKNS
jgi:hypothetical protein